MPILAETEPQRLSKHVVINESIARHKHLRSTCVCALESIRALIQERDELLVEVNAWRNSTGVNPRQPVEVNLNTLVALEVETQRHPSVVSAGHGVQYNSDSSLNRVEDQSQPEPSDPATVHLVPIVPEEIVTETFPASMNHLEGLVHGSSWPPTNQDSLPLPAVSQPNGSVLPHNNGPTCCDQAATGVLAKAPNEFDTCQLFGDVDMNQPMLISALHPSTQASAMNPPEPTVFNPIGQLDITEVSPDILLSHNESWGLWPG